MALKKQERQALILDILSREVIDSQEGLMNSLQAAGIEVTCNKRFHAISRRCVHCSSSDGIRTSPAS